jgi:hypothetical protein
MSEGSDDAIDRVIQQVTQPRPANSELWIPNQETTDEAIEAIRRGRAEAPATILQELAVAVIETVTRIDQVYNVGRYLTELKIICKDVGSFELEIADKNCEQDPQELADAVAAELDLKDHAGYHKPLRRIDIGFGAVD